MSVVVPPNSAALLTCEAGALTVGSGKSGWTPMTAATGVAALAVLLLFTFVAKHRGRHSRDGEDLLFSQKDGTPLTDSVVTEAFRRQLVLGRQPIVVGTSVDLMAPSR